MTATLAAFLGVFSDMGLSWAVVQEEQLRPGQVDNLFWVNVAVGAGLWLLTAAAGPLLSSFYGTNELTAVAAVLGAGFLIGGLAVQPQALLTRRLRQKQIAKVEIISIGAGALTAVALALTGWGYWALAAQGLAAQSVRCAGLFVCADYWPKAPSLRQGSTSLLRLGGHLTASGMITYLGRNLDKVLIGRVWGTAELGYYTRAYSLFFLPAMLVTGSLTNVIVPTLSALKGDRAQMAELYRGVLGLIALVACPLSVLLAVTAPEAVRLVYGPQWLPSVPILLCLSVTGVSQPVLTTAAWLYLALGEGRRLLVVTAGATICICGGFLIGVQWGAIGIAVTYSVVAGLLLPLPVLYLAHRVARIELWPTMRVLGPIFAASLLLAAPSYAAGELARAASGSWLSVLAAKCLAGLGCYAATIAALRVVYYGDAYDRLRSHLSQSGTERPVEQALAGP